MNYLERRYMGSTPYREDDKTRTPVEIVSAAILVILVLIAAIAGLRALHTEAMRAIDSLLLKAEAAELPKSEAAWERELCANLGRYSNGADYEGYCAGTGTALGDTGLAN